MSDQPLTWTEETVYCDGVTWTVSVTPSGECAITDELNERVHHSNGQKSTAMHLAMALSENRVQRKKLRDLNTFLKAELPQ